MECDMRVVLALLVLVIMAAGCGRDAYVAPMCACAYDEICVDDVCKPMSDDVVPAPEDGD